METYDYKPAIQQMFEPVQPARQAFRPRNPHSSTVPAASDSGCRAAALGRQVHGEADEFSFSQNCQGLDVRLRGVEKVRPVKAIMA
jgi:hypothetical protein